MLCVFGHLFAFDAMSSSHFCTGNNMHTRSGLTHVFKVNLGHPVSSRVIPSSEWCIMSALRLDRCPNDAVQLNLVRSSSIIQLPTNGSHSFTSAVQCRYPRPFKVMSNGCFAWIRLVSWWMHLVIAGVRPSTVYLRSRRSSESKPYRTLDQLPEQTSTALSLNVFKRKFKIHLFIEAFHY